LKNNANNEFADYVAYRLDKATITGSSEQDKGHLASFRGKNWEQIFEI
jgi:hypothetical protein